MCLTIILLISLAACGNATNNKASTTNSDGGNSSGNSKVTIQFMTSSVEQARIAVIKKLISKFEAANPNITVKPVPVQENEYNTKIITLAHAGKLPAVIEVGQDYAKVMDKDQLIDKQAVNTTLKTIGTDNFYNGALRLLKTQDGKNYTGVPISGWVQGIWYNKKMLASKGFSAPKTWDDILKVAKAFTDKPNKKYGIALPTVDGEFSEQSFSQFALSNNANILDSNGNLNIDTPEMKQALTFYKQLSQYTMPGSNDVTQVKDAFMNGTAPMAVYSTYILPAVYAAKQSNNIGFVIPTEKQKAVYGTTSALTISSGLSDAKKSAAEKFISFLAKPDNMTEWVLMSPGGAQPVNKLVTDNPKYKANDIIKSFGSLSSEIASSFNDIQVFGLVDGKSYLKMGAITSSGAVGKMVNSVTVDGANPEDAIKAAKQTINSVLNK